MRRQPAVVVGVSMLENQRIGEWSDRIDAGHTAFFRQRCRPTLRCSCCLTSSAIPTPRLGGLSLNILAGFAVILAVLFLTLGWRAALIVALALPLTVAFTLACMRAWGLPIHQMSVTGLVVALGIMVDNAIVMTDTIQRLRREGLGRFEAVSKALSHLWMPLAGSTLTTILAFMPIAIMPGTAGEFVGGIALSVIFALIGSYLISHTLVAGIAGRFLRARDRHTGLQLATPTAARFRAALRWSLDHPGCSIALALVLPLCRIPGGHADDRTVFSAV